MKIFIRLLLLLGALPLSAQLNIPGVTYVNVAPSGPCGFAPPIQILKSNGFGYGCNNGTWAIIFSGSSSGTVSSVGLQINGGSSSGIFAVSGSPVIASGSLNYNLTGTSGGLPYFSSASILSTSAAMSANLLIKGGGAGTAPSSSQTTDDGTNPVQSPNGFNVFTAGGYDYTVANNTSTGTTAQTMACDDGTGKAIVCPHATSTTNVPIGFTVSGAGATGNSVQCNLGWCTVKFDNSTTARHYAIESTTVDGELHDAGTALTAGQANFFIWTANGGAGNAGIVRMLIADDFNNASPTAVYKLQVNGTGLTSSDTVNFNNSTPAAGTNGKNVTFQTSKAGSTDSISAEIVGNGTATTYLDGTGNYSTPSGGISGLTASTIPKATSATAIGNSLLSDLSNQLAYTGSNGMLLNGTGSVNSITVEETGNGTVSGAFAVNGNGPYFTSSAAAQTVASLTTQNSAASYGLSVSFNGFYAFTNGVSGQGNPFATFYPANNTNYSFAFGHQVTDTQGLLEGSGFVSAGTKFTASGCTNSTTVGGSSVGSFHSGTTGTCTVTITMGLSNSVALTSNNGWACHANDQTTPADTSSWSTTSSTTTTATISGTTVSGDVISFECFGY